MSNADEGADATGSPSPAMLARTAFSPLTAAADGEVGDALAIGTPEPSVPTAEQRVIGALRHGDPADFDAWLGAAPDVAVASGWDATRTLPAEFIVRLCTTPKASSGFVRGIRIKGARIVGEIDLTTATLETLLLLERCRIEGRISLRDATTRLVNFAGSRVMGEIDADRLTSKGGVYLRHGFVCESFVRLSAAVIEGDVSCKQGTILGDEDGLALRCDRMHLSGSAFLQTFTARGEVRFLDADIGANLELVDATLSNPGKTALLADNVRVTGSLVMSEWKETPDGRISLKNASAGVLRLGALTERWPKAGTVQAQGFAYSALESDTPVTMALCERWLGVMVATPFSSQPYERVSKILREAGFADEAKRIAIRRRWKQLRAPGGSPLRKLGDLVFGALIGFGYRPGWSVWMLIACAAFGTLVFDSANTHGAMTPSHGDAILTDAKGRRTLQAGYPPLNPVVYSIDVLLPIVDLQQDANWRPNVDVRGAVVIGPITVTRYQIGEFALYYMWFQIAVGWVLSSLLVASFSGLIRNE